MDDSLFSPAWYRVAQLKPKVRSHSQIHRHIYRGELWYVLQDHVSGRFYRFSPIGYRFIGLMDGKHTVQELWEDVCSYYGDDAPSQSDIIRLLSQLHAADVLLCDVTPDTEELLQRTQRIEGQAWKTKLRSPLFLKFPLFDPDKFLNATRFIAFILFSKPGFIIWGCTIFVAFVHLWLNWAELTTGIIDRVLARDNLLILWLVYPLVKSFHELAHGYAVKRWGGEVHEIGIMLLVFMPIPYVDATAASAFQHRWQRVLVGAAGILMELFLAALAMFVWISTDPGMVRSIAYNVMLIGGVSTVLFNGNPLLRYDGYYILADLLNIPNLTQRSLQYLGYLTNRYLFQVAEAPQPYAGPGERFWFVVYGIASFIYRMFVYTAIILFVAGKFFFIGVMLAILGGYNMVVLPLSKKIYGLFTAPLYQNNRGRTLLIVTLLLSGIIALLFLAPFPYMVRTEGVVWVPQNSLVRAGTDGLVTQIKTKPGSEIDKGDLLVETDDPFLQTQTDILKYQLQEYELRRSAAYASDRIKADILDKEIGKIRKKLDWLAEQLGKLSITSPRQGYFVLPRSEDLIGRYVTKGELLGYVLEADTTIIRLVVFQEKADLIRERTRNITLREAGKISEVYPGVIVREVPLAINRLPSDVLSVSGGGAIAIDPMDSSGSKTFENLFQFDIVPSVPFNRLSIGSRVYLRFDLGREPLAFQWMRSLRQLLLKRFNV